MTFNTFNQNKRYGSTKLMGVVVGTNYYTNDGLIGHLLTMDASCISEDCTAFRNI